MITYSFLQHYWWFIISLLAGLLSFLLFVQGGQTLIGSLGKTEDEKKLLVNVLGKKWEYTFTTLVTFGGAFFASFPLFYSTSFGGAYWVWMIILFCFIVQAISYEYQSKPGNFFGKNAYRGFLFFNGLAGTFLIGAAIATFFTGSLFSINKVNITEFTGQFSPVISQWQTPLHGLEALGNLRNWFLGLAVFFLARTLATLYFKNRIDNAAIESRLKGCLVKNALPFLVFFLAFLIWTLVAEGFAVNPDTGVVFMEKFKYLHNLVQVPILLVLLLIGVVGVLTGIVYSFINDTWRKGIWFAGVGTVITVCTLLLVAGYNNTAYYPSIYDDLQSSLTIFNSSSSFYTLKVMSIVSLLIPFVLAYIIYAWRALEKSKTNIEELAEPGNHAY